MKINNKEIPNPKAKVYARHTTDDDDGLKVSTSSIPLIKIIHCVLNECLSIVSVL